MVSSVSNTPIAQPAQPKTTKTSIFYVNDVHSNLTNIEKLKNASDEFDSFTPSEKTDKLKFSVGDIGVGRELQFSKVAVAYQNLTGVMASAGGNHEFDLNKNDLVDVLKDAKYKFLGLNVNIPQDTEINRKLRKDIIQSYVQEQNGTKYGVIGLMPFDFAFHLSDPAEYKDFEILSIEKTIPLIQEQVDDFKKQGIDKIIILSHIGSENDQKLVQSVEGIDVIMGGHDHKLIKDIKDGKNLFYSKKTGEPTIITQAGKDGNYFGVLNLEFNDKGVITKAQNNVTNTEDYPRSLLMRDIINKILGKPKELGTIKAIPKHKHTLIDENPSADFVLDAEKSELGVDMVLINSANFRSSLEPGILTDRDLKILTPFDNKVWIIKLTEKEVVEALKVGAKSLVKDDNTPGIIQCSGLRYTISKSGELKAASLVDKDNKEIPIDINNPNTFKTYTVATDDFIAKGGNKYFENKEDSVTTKFNFDKNKLVEDYMKKHPEPVEISTEKRITFVD
ncbi:MAG: 5'-nucleotidase C-terminal domain-containing protein [Candidatus Gastranaerophilaceae bacterium]